MLNPEHCHLFITKTRHILVWRKNRLALGPTLVHSYFKFFLIRPGLENSLCLFSSAPIFISAFELWYFFAAAITMQSNFLHIFFFGGGEVKKYILILNICPSVYESCLRKAMHILVRTYTNLLKKFINVV